MTKTSRSGTGGVLQGVGLLLAIQGVGGAINNLADGGPSWFVLNHVAAIESIRLPLHLVLALIGLGLMGVPGFARWRQR